MLENKMQYISKFDAIFVSLHKTAKYIAYGLRPITMVECEELVEGLFGIIFVIYMENLQK